MRKKSVKEVTSRTSRATKALAFFDSAARAATSQFGKSSKAVSGGVELKDCWVRLVSRFSLTPCNYRSVTACMRLHLNYMPKSPLLPRSRLCLLAFLVAAGSAGASEAQAQKNDSYADVTD